MSTMPRYTKELRNKDFYRLGKRAKDGEVVYLQDFRWECNWYWGGGYLIVFKNDNIHQMYHFDSTFIDVDADEMPKYDYWEKCVLDENEWWRLLDLFKQFYTYRDAAECAEYGGHLTSRDRREDEVRPRIQSLLNVHIENTIIPAIQVLVKK